MFLLTFPERLIDNWNFPMFRNTNKLKA